MNEILFPTIALGAILIFAIGMYAGYGLGRMHERQIEAFREFRRRARKW